MRLRVLPDGVAAGLSGLGFAGTAALLGYFHYYVWPWANLILVAGLLVPLAFWEDL